MKKLFKYLEWLPFAISLGSLVIYLVYTIQIKLNPAIIVTDKLIGTLKAYLIIALVSLFIGLLIILIKKIRRLMNTEEKVVKETTIRQYTIPKEEKVIITEPKKEEVITIKEEPYKETIVKEIKVEEEPVITEIKEDPYKETIIKETKIVEEPVVTETKIVRETPTYTYKVKGVVCPECNNYISKNAGICPHCGILFDDEIIRLIKKYEKGKYKVKRKPLSLIANILLTILFIILIFLVCNMLYNKYNQNLQNINRIIQRK